MTKSNEENIISYHQFLCMRLGVDGPKLRVEIGNTRHTKTHSLNLKDVESKLYILFSYYNHEGIPTQSLMYLIILHKPSHEYNLRDPFTNNNNEE